MLSRKYFDTFQDIKNEYFKSFASKVADLIVKEDEEGKDEKSLVITVEKRIVLDTHRQLLVFEFGKNKFIEIYPILVPNSKTVINLDAVIDKFYNDADDVSSKNILIDDVYNDLVLNLEPLLKPTILPNKKISPEIEHAKAVSRNRIVVQFDSKVRATKECLRGIPFETGNPHICCQIIFREKPLLKGNNIFVINS